MKELKLGFNSEETGKKLIDEDKEVDADEEYEEPVKRISLFKRNSFYEDEGEHSQDDSPDLEPMVYTFQNRVGQYSFKRSGEFSKTEKLHTKRNSSPLGEHTNSSLLKTSTKNMQKRRVSKSSSGSDLERDNENGTSTTATVPLYSRLSSSEKIINEQNKNIVPLVSPFEKVDEVKEGEEHSPDTHQRDRRRDSMNDDLDHLQAFFGQNICQKRISAVHRKENPKL